MFNDNLKELVYKCYDERECLQDLLKFYKLQAEDKLHLKYIYNTWINDVETKLKEIEIEIDYLQSELV